MQTHCHQDREGRGGAIEPGVQARRGMGAPLELEMSWVPSARHSRIPHGRMLTQHALIDSLASTPAAVRGPDGPALVPGIYAPGAPRRASGALGAQLVVYDLDGPSCYDKRRKVFDERAIGDWANRDSILAWIGRQPEDPIDELLARCPLPGVAYTTWSHAWAKAWAWRIVMWLPEVVEPKRWKGIWRGCYEQLGGQAVGLDPRCSDISRLFYLPSRAAQAEKMGISPGFCARLITPNRHVGGSARAGWAS